MTRDELAYEIEDAVITIENALSDLRYAFNECELDVGLNLIRERAERYPIGLIESALNDLNGGSAMYTLEDIARHVREDDDDE